jgi:hypothetical protein
LSNWRGDRLFFDQALRDTQVIYRETSWDVARTLAALLQHVWTEKHSPQECVTCARAEIYSRVLEGHLHLEEEGDDRQ